MFTHKNVAVTTQSPHPYRFTQGKQCGFKNFTSLDMLFSDEQLLLQNNRLVLFCEAAALSFLDRYHHDGD
jgi:hypothetical protein